MISRREFLARMRDLGAGGALAAMAWRMLEGSPAWAAAMEKSPHPAKYWQAAGEAARCELCPRGETLQPGSTGFCRVRQNRPGGLVTHGWDQPCVLNVDPIEKNPLAHVRPGAQVLSVAHAGCNLRCLYCQNWQYSQHGPTETRNLEDFDRSSSVAAAGGRKLAGLAFTYTEPTSCVEFVADMAALAKSRGLMPTLCTCGYVQAKPLKDLLGPFAAVTVTYKGPSEEFYREMCSASLKPVQDSMLLIKSEGKWLEVATLIVPARNDDEQSLRTMATWIARNLGPQTPWHIERFSPQYKLTNLPPTPQATMEKARAIGREAGLKFVYISNFAPHEGNHTYCPGCRKAVIRRLGFKVLANDLRQGRCPCGQTLPGVWT